MARWAVTKGHIVYCEGTRDAGFHAIRTLLAVSEPPTAVVCHDDIVALGAILGLRKFGLEPGTDCSMVGSDGMSEAALWQPALTTMAIDARRIGIEAAGLIEQRMAHPDAPRRHVRLLPRGVVRASSFPSPQTRQG